MPRHSAFALGNSLSASPDDRGTTQYNLTRDGTLIRGGAKLLLGHVQYNRTVLSVHHLAVMVMYMYIT